MPMKSSCNSVFLWGEWERRLLVIGLNQALSVTPSLSLQTQPCSSQAAPGLGNPRPLVCLANVSSSSRRPETAAPQTSFLEESLKTTRSLSGQSQKSFCEDRSLLLYEKSCPGQRRAALGASDKIPFSFLLKESTNKQVRERPTSLSTVI